MVVLDKELSQKQIQQFVASIHDRMTECLYETPIETFETNIKPEVCSTSFMAGAEINS